MRDGDWERRLEEHTAGIMRELDDGTERSLNAALAVLIIGLCLLEVAAGLKQLWLGITVFGLMVLGNASIVTLNRRFNRRLRQRDKEWHEQVRAELRSGHG
jgi:Zn-dependent membrane protease YugP